VIRAGQVFFDFDRICKDGVDDDTTGKHRLRAGSPPPAYRESDDAAPSNDNFTIDDGEEESNEFVGTDPQPALLRADRFKPYRASSDVLIEHGSGSVDANASQASDALRDALHGIESTSRLTSNDALKSQTKPASATSKNLAEDGLTRQYWLRTNDTLMSLSLRFKVNASVLCKLNDLPPSTLTSTPHLIHTRRFLLIPARAVDDLLNASPEQSSQLEAALQGPAPMSRRAKVDRARKQAQSRFRALVLQGTAVDRRKASETTTPCDERAARAYIALMEEELRVLEFGDDAVDGTLSEAHDDKTLSDKRADDDEALQDAARERRFDAIVKQAVCRWEMDSDWERAQRAQGLHPDAKQIGSISKPGPSNANATFSTAIPSWLRLGSSGGASSHSSLSVHHKPRAEKAK
jgi:hypothetical protein